MGFGIPSTYVISRSCPETHFATFFASITHQQERGESPRNFLLFHCTPTQLRGSVAWGILDTEVMMKIWQWQNTSSVNYQRWNRYGEAEEQIILKKTCETLDGQRGSSRCDTKEAAQWKD